MMMIGANPPRRSRPKRLWCKGKGSADVDGCDCSQCDSDVSHGKDRVCMITVVDDAFAAKAVRDIEWRELVDGIE